MYHVHTRGNDRQALYFGNWSGRLFVRELERAALRHRWRILAYCLMTNHYHLVLKIDERLSAGMCELNGRFATTSNWVNKRKDHLFGRRFTSHLIEDDPYLLASVRYVLLNPVRSVAGIQSPELGGGAALERRSASRRRQHGSIRSSCSPTSAQLRRQRVGGSTVSCSKVSGAPHRCLAPSEG